MSSQVKSYNLCEDIDRLLEECDKGADVGLPIKPPILNNVIGGSVTFINSSKFCIVDNSSTLIVTASLPIAQSGLLLALTLKRELDQLSSAMEKDLILRKKYYLHV